MPTPTTWPSAKQAIGLAVETTQGTANTVIAASAPVLEFTPNDKFVWLPDNGLRGSMTERYGNIQGPRSVEFTMSGAVFCDWLPFLVRNIMGDLTTTGAGPYTHAMSLLNSGTAQPSSLTITDWQGLTPTTFARTYSGCCLSELTLRGNPESTLVEFSAKGIGFTSAAYPASAPTFSFSTDAPMAAWRTSIGLGGPASGGTINLSVRNWEWTATRELRPQWTSGNTQLPYIIQRGKLTVAGMLYHAVPSDETYLNYLINNTQPQLQILIDNGGATTAQRQLQLDVAAASYTGLGINRSEETVGQDGTWEAIANTTNAGASGGYSPSKVTVINNTASGY